MRLVLNDQIHFTSSKRFSNANIVMRSTGVNVTPGYIATRLAASICSCAATPTVPTLCCFTSNGNSFETSCVNACFSRSTANRSTSSTLNNLRASLQSMPSLNVLSFQTGFLNLFNNTCLSTSCFIRCILQVRFKFLIRNINSTFIEIKRLLK